MKNTHQKQNIKASFDNEVFISNSDVNGRLSRAYNLSDSYILMNLAIQEAKKAYLKNEVPVGALLTDGKDFLVKAHNLREKQQSPLSHAEILCLKKASEKFKSWRLENLICVVTLEPCLMCMGALLQARVKKIIYACRDAKAGACGSLFSLANDSRLNHQIEVEEGVYAKESSELMSQFFSELREKKARAKSDGGTKIVL